MDRRINRTMEERTVASALQRDTGLLPQKEHFDFPDRYICEGFQSGIGRLGRHNEA